MTINIKATKTTLTQGIRDYIDEKITTIQKFIKSEDKIHIELEVDKKHKSGLVFRAEIDIRPHGHYADARGSDIYEAIDLVVPKIREQLTKLKDKKISLRRRRAKLH